MLENLVPVPLGASSSISKVLWSDTVSLKYCPTYDIIGFVVLGFPSHDFYQEPAPEQDIKDFCNLTYDVKFPMFTKVNVRGEKAHPFYKNLAAETNSSPKWNFWKYLINKDGDVVKSYSMVTSPKGDKLVSMINKLLSE